MKIGIWSAFQINLGPLWINLSKFRYIREIIVKVWMRYEYKLLRIFDLFVNIYERQIDKSKVHVMKSCLLKDVINANLTMKISSRVRITQRWLVEFLMHNVCCTVTFLHLHLVMHPPPSNILIWHAKIPNIIYLISSKYMSTVSTTFLV